jgi:ATP-dependent DNA ligase
MGLEGIVSKRLGSRYRSGRTSGWLKFKNPAAPAVGQRPVAFAAPYYWSVGDSKHFARCRHATAHGLARVARKCDRR